MCMYGYMYTYVCMYTCMHGFIYEYVSTYICIHVYVRIHVCIRVYIYMYACVCTNTHAGAAELVWQIRQVPDQNFKPQFKITIYVFGMYMHRY